MGKTEQKRHLKLLPNQWESELALTQAAARMDSQARHDLVDMLFTRIRRLSIYLSGKTWEPEDLAQTALIEILNSAGNYRGESSIERWADRITVHTALKQVEKSTRRDRLKHKIPEPVETIPSPDKNAENTRIRKKLIELMGTLSPERREVVVLRLVHGYSISEISELTDSLTNTVRDRLRIGRKQLRKKILADPLLREWDKKRKQ